MPGLASDLIQGSDVTFFAFTEPTYAVMDDPENFQADDALNVIKSEFSSDQGSHPREDNASGDTRSATGEIQDRPSAGFNFEAYFLPANAARTHPDIMKSILYDGGNGIFETAEMGDGPETGKKVFAGGTITTTTFWIDSTDEAKWPADGGICVHTNSGREPILRVIDTVTSDAGGLKITVVQPFVTAPAVDDAVSQAIVYKLKKTPDTSITMVKRMGNLYQILRGVVPSKATFDFSGKGEGRVKIEGFGSSVKKVGKDAIKTGYPQYAKASVETDAMVFDYTVGLGTNDTITLSTDLATTPAEATIAAADYSQAALVSELQSKLDTALGGAGKVEVVASGADKIILRSPTTGTNGWINVASGDFADDVGLTGDVNYGNRLYPTDVKNFAAIDEIILIDSEEQKVTGRDYTNGYLTVTRAVGGTSAADHAVAAVIDLYTPANPVTVGDPIRGIYGRCEIKTGTLTAKKLRLQGFSVEIDENAKAEDDIIGEDGIAGFFYEDLRRVSGSVKYRLSNDMIPILDNIQQAQKDGLYLQMGAIQNNIVAFYMPRMQLIWEGIPDTKGVPEMSNKFKAETTSSAFEKELFLIVG